MCNDDGTLADHDRGLGFDLETLQTRQTLQAHRRTAVLGVLGAATVAGGAVLATGSGGSAASAASAAGACAAEIPSETAGPYPGDGSNGPDVLTESGIVRSDIRRSFAGSRTRARGVPLTFGFVLQDAATCEPVKGLAVYAWHCDRAGEYSMYSGGITDENYLRGVQVSDRRGRVAFRSIYPGCYSGRWPHVHFEVYRTRHAATHGGSVLVTSQMALPRAESMKVYRQASGYTGSEANLDRISLRSDNVFGDDGGARQLATISGGVAKGYVAGLVVPVDL